MFGILLIHFIDQIQLFWLFEIVFYKTTGSYFLVQIDCSLDIQIQPWCDIELQTILATEIVLYAFDVTVKVLDCTWMRRADHLWKVDQCDLLVVVKHQVELVEVAMDQPMLGQSYDKGHKVSVDGLWVSHFVDRCHWIALHTRHHDGVSVVVDGLGHWKLLVVQCLHERKLLDR